MKKFSAFLLSLALILSLLAGMTPALKVRAATTISDVSIRIDEPEEGKTPDYIPMLYDIWGNVKFSNLSDTSVRKYGTIWQDLTTDTSMFVDVDCFEAGHVYMVTVYVAAKEGYVFTENTTATFNQDEPLECVLDGDELRVSYVFPEVKAKEVVDSVSVTFALPRAGDKPDFAPDFPDGAHYYYEYYVSEEITDFEDELIWYDLTASKRLYEGGASFEAGHQYRVTINLYPEKGYKFTNSTTAEINGNSAECSLDANDFSDNFIVLTYTFTNVAPQLAITTQPKYLTVTVGNKATFKVVASGTGLKYQWQYKKPGDSTYTNVSKNGTSATYSLTTAARHNGYFYRCVVSDSYGSKNSDVAKLTLRPAIVTQPSSVGVKEGKKATFAVVATGTDLTYQWQYKKPGDTTWTNVSKNGTSAAYSLTAAARHNGYTYRCKVTFGGGSYVYSGSAKLTVRPNITTQPTAVSVQAGKKATFTVVASGTGLTYQWQYKKPGDTTWTNVSKNGTSATYSLTTAARHNGYVYRCKVTNSGGGYVYSSSAKLTVK